MPLRQEPHQPLWSYPPTKEFDLNGIPVSQKAICYVDDWYKGFTVLTWYRNGEYYEGREKELSTMLGHAFSDVTNKVYRHRELDALREQIERIKVCR